MRKRVVLASVVVVASAIVFAACSESSGLGLARQACGDVHLSIVSYEAGMHASNRSTTSHDLKRATVELQKAEPLAAAATSADGQWNALMTTLNELGQVDEGHLISALRAQCAVANSSQLELPNGPGPLPSGPGPNQPKSTTTTSSGVTTTS
jgi:hypothetical protein